MFDICVILAGGRGERLRPLTDSTPKPLIHLNDTSILEEQINYLSRQGIQNFLLLTGYKSSAFENLCQKYEKISHIRVQAFQTPKEYQTLNRIFSAKHLLTGDVLILYGDNYVEVDSNELYKSFKYRGITADSISVLATKRKLSRSKQRKFNDMTITYNPYSAISPTNVDVGFFCISSHKLCQLLDLPDLDLDQKFEDWYFGHNSLERRYLPYYWSYLSLTDMPSLEEARSYFNSKITLFTDRDGVLLSSKSRSKYIKDVSDIQFNDDFLNILSKFRHRLKTIVVVTNQPWVRDDLDELYKRTSHYVEQYIRRKTGIASVITFTCSHPIEERCLCRKPKPGLFLKYLNSVGEPLLPSRSRFIGDSSSDVGVAKHLMLEYMDISLASAASLETWFQL